MEQYINSNSTKRLLDTLNIKHYQRNYKKEKEEIPTSESELIVIVSNKEVNTLNKLEIHNTISEVSTCIQLILQNSLKILNIII